MDSTTALDDRLLLTIPEAASLLGIGRSKLYDLIAAGDIEVVHLGRSARVPREGLLDFVRTLRAS